MNEIDHKLIGMRVREKRLEMHYSQEHLAESTGLSPVYISNIETGKKKASLESLISIANVLGVTLDELLSGNQLYNPTDYQTDIDELMSDCSANEKRFIYELLRSSKSILRTNSWVLRTEASEENNNL